MLKKLVFNDLIGYILVKAVTYQTLHLVPCCGIYHFVDDWSQI